MQNHWIDRRTLLGYGAGATLAATTPVAIAQAVGRASFDWKLHRPEEVGMSTAGLAGVRAAIQKHIDRRAIPGAVTAIARHNKLVWFEAQGQRDVEAAVPVRKDDMFRMMSSSKPVTAVAVLMLIEAGKLSLDDKVSRFLPSFKDPKVAIAPEGWQRAMANPSARATIVPKIQLVPAARELTIRDLLTHTNGLPTGGPGGLVSDVPHLPNEPLAAYALRVGARPLDFQPGTRFAYSPADAFDVLLAIVEIVSRVTADVFVRERILQPLAMKDTYYSVPPAKQERVVKLYDRKGDAWATASSPFGNGPTGYFSGAGGLLSTVHDFMQFEQMLLNQGELNGRRLLRPSTVGLMATNHVGDLYENAIPGMRALTAGRGFGLGVAITLDPVAANTGRGKGAFGWNGAYGTDSWADPELDLAAAFFVQSPAMPATFMAGADFQKAIRAAIVA